MPLTTSAHPLEVAAARECSPLRLGRPALRRMFPSIEKPVSSIDALPLFQSSFVNTAVRPGHEFETVESAPAPATVDTTAQSDRPLDPVRTGRSTPAHPRRSQWLAGLEVADAGSAAPSSLAVAHRRSILPCLRSASPALFACQRSAASPITLESQSTRTFQSCSTADTVSEAGPNRWCRSVSRPGVAGSRYCIVANTQITGSLDLVVAPVPGLVAVAAIALTNMRPAEPLLRSPSKNEDAEPRHQHHRPRHYCSTSKTVLRSRGWRWAASGWARRSHPATR